MKIITRTVILFSVVSLFTDIVSEMVYPIMPMYLTSIGFSVMLYRRMRRNSRSDSRTK